MTGLVHSKAHAIVVQSVCVPLASIKADRRVPVNETRPSQMVPTMSVGPCAATEETTVSIVDGDVAGGTPAQQLSLDVLIAPSSPEEHVAYAGTSRGKGGTGRNFTRAQQAR